MGSSSASKGTVGSYAYPGGGATLATLVAADRELLALQAEVDVKEKLNTTLMVSVNKFKTATEPGDRGCTSQGGLPPAHQIRALHSPQ